RASLEASPLARTRGAYEAASDGDMNSGLHAFTPPSTATGGNRPHTRGSRAGPRSSVLLSGNADDRHDRLQAVTAVLRCAGPVGTARARGATASAVFVC